MSLPEVINAMQERLLEYNEEQGEFNAETLEKLLLPLHHALYQLAKQEVACTTSS